MRETGNHERRQAGSMKSYNVPSRSYTKPACSVMNRFSIEAILQDSLILSALLFLCLFIYFALLTPRALTSGDAALYVQQIRDLDFTHRTVHLGYYLIGFPFIHLLPLPPEYVLNLMSCAYAALSIATLFLITVSLTGSRTASFTACLIAATASLFASNAVFAEVYGAQLFFFLFSIALLFYKKPVFAGISYAVSFLITPSAIFGLAMLFPFRKDRARLFRFVISALIIIISVVSLVAPDYVIGGRGLLKASRASLTISVALLKEYREFFSTIAWYVPFLLAGAIEMIRCVRYREWGLTIFCIWLFILIAGERFGDVPVQLPSYALICIMTGLGFQSVINFLRAQGRLLTAAVYLFLFISVIYSGITARNHIMNTSARFEAYRETVYALKHAAQPDFIAVGPWTEGILFEHYFYGASYTGMWINKEWLTGIWGDAKRAQSLQALNRAIRDGQELWLLKYDAPLFSQLQQRGYRITPFRTVFRALPARTAGS
jgi:hypothetical protein